MDDAITVLFFTVTKTYNIYVQNKLFLIYLLAAY